MPAICSESYHCQGRHSNASGTMCAHNFLRENTDPPGDSPSYVLHGTGAHPCICNRASGKQPNKPHQVSIYIPACMLTIRGQFAMLTNFPKAPVLSTLTRGKATSTTMRWCFGICSPKDSVPLLVVRCLNCVHRHPPRMVRILLAVPCNRLRPVWAAHLVRGASRKLRMMLSRIHSALATLGPPDRGRALVGVSWHVRMFCLGLYGDGKHTGLCEWVPSLFFPLWSLHRRIDRMMWMNCSLTDYHRITRHATSM